MKGQRTRKYFIQIDTTSNYLSRQQQITCKQFWDEYENCKETMNNHNEYLDGDEKEYDSYTLDKKVQKLEHATSTEYRFDFIGTIVYLTMVQCDEGYKFSKK